MYVGFVLLARLIRLSWCSFRDSSHSVLGRPVVRTFRHLGLLCAKLHKGAGCSQGEMGAGGQEFECPGVLILGAHNDIISF